MSMRKARLTITVDPSLVRAGSEAVKEGRAESLSAWVGAALAERAAKERRLRALGEAVARFEARFGTIEADELSAQLRADRESARVVRGRGSAGSSRRRSRSRSAA